MFVNMYNDKQCENTIKEKEHYIYNDAIDFIYQMKGVNRVFFHCI